ncbi:MAG: hypothetical protein WCX65_09930 [bacterium]
MKRLIITAAVLILCAGAARAQDSMANFRSLIENASPPAADIGGFAAPEIFSVNQYPLRPGPGEDVIVRAKVGCYNSMVGYKIEKVELTYWKTGGEKKTVEMKAEDAQAGIYSATILSGAEGDEFFYAVSAVDNWGAAAREVYPGSDWQLLMDDDEDKTLSPAMDVRKVEASFPSENNVRLCMELGAKPEKMSGKDLVAYAIGIFGRDVRYKPELTESELTSAWLGAYLPAFSVSDLVPAAEMMSMLAPAGKKEKRADFMKKENRLCFSFAPSLIRSDYVSGLKVVGLTIAVNTGSMSIKPQDATHPVMFYPISHSYKVYKVK